MSPRRVRMGTCPLCETDIHTNQHTSWRLVEGAPARVHGTCLNPPVTRRPVAFSPQVGYTDLQPQGLTTNHKENTVNIKDRVQINGVPTRIPTVTLGTVTQVNRTTVDVKADGQDTRWEYLGRTFRVPLSAVEGAPAGASAPVGAL